MRTRKQHLSLFAESSLVILISIVTLLLQLISFATTWSGSKVYLEDIFPYASFVFALAIQATAYFLSNSLRTRVSLLKTVALLTALCCSTYYSYIGIYNSVNSPESYLQQSYVRIADELTQVFDTHLEEGSSRARETVNEAASLITANYTSLVSEQKNIAACREALAGTTSTYSDGMRAPRQSAYENYEDYVAAYNTYIAGVSAGNNTEKEAVRTGVLSSYGFASIEELNEAEITNSAALSALTAALGLAQDDGADTAVSFAQDDIATDDEASSDASAAVPAAIADIQNRLTTAIENASFGIAFTSSDIALLNNFLQAAKLCGYEEADVAGILNTIDQCAKVTSAPLLSDYLTLVSLLPDGRVTSANTMELKTAMDSEILSALLKINALLPEEEQLSFSDARFQITDLYLIPIKALQDTDTKLTALFCLAVAALIDVLSVLFAISLRGRKPLWGKRTLFWSSFEDYAPQIYASLPADTAVASSLTEFLSFFKPSPQTEGDGYMMYAKLDTLAGFYPLTALLCQINLAKIIPAGFSQNETDILLLKARFVFWANEIIYEKGSHDKEVFA
ncbi:MAG: hypothetical protein ACI4TB_07540 [Lachnospiraceae bacterium]